MKLNKFVFLLSSFMILTSCEEKSNYEYRLVGAEVVNCVTDKAHKAPRFEFRVLIRNLSSKVIIIPYDSIRKSSIYLKNLNNESISYSRKAEFGFVEEFDFEFDTNLSIRNENPNIKIDPQESIVINYSFEVDLTNYLLNNVIEDNFCKSLDSVCKRNRLSSLRISGLEWHPLNNKSY